MQRRRVEAAMLGQQVLIHLVQRVGGVVPVFGKAVRRVIFSQLRMTGREHGQEGERGNPHPPEGLVGHFAGVIGLRTLAADARDGVLHPVAHLRRAERTIERRAPAAGLIDIKISGAVSAQLVKHVVRIPGGAREAPVRVPVPPGHLEAAPELSPCCVGDARKLHERGVARRVVVRPDVPRVDVPAHEGVFIAPVRGRNARHGHEGLAPGGIRLGMNA